MTQEFTLSDGDFVEVVWNKEKPKDNQPIVVLFHGLAGSVNSPYIVGLMNALHEKGYACVLMHFRGCGKKENLKPRAYHSGDTADAKAWIEHLHKTYPNNPLNAVGFSIGGNMLLKLLGECQEQTPLRSAVSVSAPMRLDICADTIEKGFAKVYQEYLLKPLKKSLLAKYKKFNMQELLGIDEQRVKEIKTVREFDECYTAPMHGFTSSEEYYARCSAKQFLKDIRTPTLIIHALDDPFMTPEILPQSDEVSEFVTLDVSPCGGHVGFVGGGLFGVEYWWEERVCCFFFDEQKP